MKRAMLTIIFVAAIILPALAAGRALHVNPTTGDDAQDGVAKPVKSIARAVKLAQPGDTIHLTPGVYFESADLTKKHGLPGRPITLDGHGAVLDGSEPLRASDWEALRKGLFRKVKLISALLPVFGPLEEYICSGAT